ncbi:MAG: phosphatidate cytidylyltransferase [Bacteroidales bacterium]|nr:phosphatidate cytidylyltransferase [Bacteroidales bacterium]
MLKRTITGTIYVISVVAAIYLPPLACAIYFAVVAALGLWEFYSNLQKTTTISPNFIGGFLVAVATYSMFLGRKYSAIALLSVALFYIVISELYRKKENPFTNIAYTVFGVMYIVVPLACTNLIRTQLEPIILMSVFIFAWCNDTFAYLTGMKFGKHKLFERISPKKTWEGFIGGFCFVVIAAIIIAQFTTALPVFDLIVIAIITSVIGTYGDLIESMFKRQIGVKDSGNILPGHGGILDRFDIMLLVLPAVTVYLMIIHSLHI